MAMVSASTTSFQQWSSKSRAMVGSRLRVLDRRFLIAPLFAAVRAGGARRRHAPGERLVPVWNRAAMQKEKAENSAIAFRLNLTCPRSPATIITAGSRSIDGERVIHEMAGSFCRRAGVG